MSYFAAYLTSLSSVPEGLLSDDFPKHLDSMFIANSNLTGLPDHLHKVWPGVAGIYLDFDQFDHLPASLAQMPNLFTLSLTSNRIRSFSESDIAGIFGRETVGVLAISNSTLHALPEQFDGTMDHTFWFNLEYTQLSEVPKCIRSWFLQKAPNNEFVQPSLFGSPYCNAMFADQEVEEEQRLYQAQVCAFDTGSALDLVGFEIVAAQRPL